jgi:hypothetical protein
MNHDSMITSEDLDKFINVQDSRQVQYVSVEKEAHTIIFSDSPIYHIYLAAALPDLGYAFSPDNLMVPTAGVSLAGDAINAVPVIPDFVIEPVVEPVVAAAPAPYYTPSHDEIYDQARHDISFMASAMKNLYQQTEREIVATVVPFVVLTAAIAAAAAAGIYARTRLRKRRKQASYKGLLGTSNEMVGQGSLFEFGVNSANKGLLLPENTSYLNLIWSVKKSSTDGAHTYFYMTFYVLPQQGYAASLQKRKAIVSYQKTKINA